MDTTTFTGSNSANHREDRGTDEVCQPLVLMNLVTVRGLQKTFSFEVRPGARCSGFLGFRRVRKGNGNEDFWQESCPPYEG